MSVWEDRWEEGRDIVIDDPSSCTSFPEFLIKQLGILNRNCLILSASTVLAVILGQFSHTTDSSVALLSMVALATHSPPHPPTHSLTHSLTHSPTHPSPHPPPHPLTHSLTHPPLTHPPPHPPTHPLTHPLTHSLTHPLTHPLTMQIPRTNAQAADGVSHGTSRQPGGVGIGRLSVPSLHMGVRTIDR